MMIQRTGKERCLLRIYTALMKPEELTTGMKLKEERMTRTKNLSKRMSMRWLYRVTEESKTKTIMYLGQIKPM